MADAWTLDGACARESPGLRSIREPAIKQGERIWDRVHTNSDYWATIVDTDGNAVIFPKSPEIFNLAIFPKDSANLLYACQRIDYTVPRTTGDLSLRIDRDSFAALNTRQRTQVW